MLYVSKKHLKILQKDKAKLSVYWKYCKKKPLNFLCSSSNLAEDVFNWLKYSERTPYHQSTDRCYLKYKPCVNCNNRMLVPNLQIQTTITQHLRHHKVSDLQAIFKQTQTQTHLQELEQPWSLTPQLFKHCDNGESILRQWYREVPSSSGLGTICYSKGMWGSHIITQDPCNPKHCGISGTGGG
jgi:hypothetical protein